MKKLILILMLLLISSHAWSGGVLDFTADTSPTSDDITYVINDPGGTPGDRKVTLGNAITKAHGLTGDGYLLKLSGTTITSTNSLTGITLGGFTASKGLCSDASGNAVACTNLTDVTPLTSANISDTAYDATSWDTVTTIAPSKNAVRDKIETLAPLVSPAFTTPSLGAATATSIVVADVTNNNYTKITNNAARTPTASVNEIYPEANIWKVNQNGTESSIIIGPTAGQVTLTGPTAVRSYAIADRAGTILTAGTTCATLTPAAAVALDVTLSNCYTDTVTDNEDQTITFSAGGVAGQEITVIFTTAGTADEIITFHATLVSSTGTLTLGTTAARYYTIRFISNGTHWYEVSRTAEQT